MAIKRHAYKRNASYLRANLLASVIVNAEERDTANCAELQTPIVKLSIRENTANLSDPCTRTGVLKSHDFGDRGRLGQDTRRGDTRKRRVISVARSSFKIGD